MVPDTDLRVALFDASLGDTPAERNVTRELGVEPVVYRVSEGELPPLPGEGAEIDAVVVTGSQTAVYDPEEWIRDVEAWVRAAAEVGVPVLGLCWGHQLVARALGGTVDPMGRYELGYERIERIAEDELLAGVGESFVAFETHSDEVTHLPGEAVILAENETSIQAFRIGDAWGVQFHPEYDERTARWVTENKRGEVPDERIEAVLADVESGRHGETREAKRVFDNFLRVVRDRVGERATAG